MSQRMAKLVFLIINILSVFAVAYAIYDFIDVITAIEVNQKNIPFDSGTYYLLLISVSWVLSIIQYSGIKNKKSWFVEHGNQVTVYWFVLMLLLANLIPYYLTNKLEDAGYVKCDDLAEISRVAKGESSIYKKSECL